MKIVLKGQDRADKDKIIDQKQKEGWVLVNITEGFDETISGPGGITTSTNLILEFTKYGN